MRPAAFKDIHQVFATYLKILRIYNIVGTQSTRIHDYDRNVEEMSKVRWTSTKGCSPPFLGAADWLAGCPMEATSSSRSTGPCSTLFTPPRRIAIDT